MLPNQNKKVLPFSSVVGDLLKGPIQRIGENNSIFESIQKMSRLKIGSLVVYNRDQPVGMITKTDIIKYLAEERSLKEPVGKIMSKKIISIQMNQPIFDGLILMSKNKISHLVVKDGEKEVGVISEQDWLTFQDHHPAVLMRTIESANTIEEIANVRKETNLLIQDLVLEEGNIATLNKLATENNDRITKRVIEYMLNEMKSEGYGSPPVSYAWLAMGSEGRKAQTIYTDQDNALIFENVSKDKLESVKEWFLRFAEKVTIGLEQCGFPLCEGKIMASNPDLCLPVEGWFELLGKSLVQVDPDEVPKAIIYFDVRCLYGDETLVEQFWKYLLEKAHNNVRFFRHYAETMMCVGRPPIKQWRWKLYPMFGIVPKDVNIKMEALTLLDAAARFLALANGISETSTLGRLQILKRKGVISSKIFDAVWYSYDFLMLLRTRNEYYNTDKDTLDLIRIRNLNRVHIQFFKISLQAVYDLQEFAFHKGGGFKMKWKFF